MPETGAHFEPLSALMSFEQIVRFVAAALPLGIRKIRLTGGEPLMRPKLPDLVAALSGFPEIRDLAVTTNGVLLREAAKPFTMRDCAGSIFIWILWIACASAKSPGATILAASWLALKLR